MDWFKNLFSIKKAEVIEETEHELGYKDWGSALSLSGVRDDLHNVYSFTRGLKCRKEECDQLDEAIANDPLFSTCFERIVSCGDTKFKIVPLLGNGEVNEEFARYIEFKFPLLFPKCYSLQNVNRLILRRLVAYGAFFAGIRLGDDGNVKRLVLPPAYSFGHILGEDGWELYQSIKGKDVLMDSNLVVDQYLNLTYTNEGVWWSAPLKPALNALYVYNLFQKSLAQVARRTGIQKVLGASVDLEALLKHYSGGRESQDEKLNRILVSQMQSINSQLPNSMILYPNILEIKDLGTIEASATLALFNEILVTNVVIGCKLYPALVGAAGKENQTTLSTNQKEMFSSFITSIQDCVDNTYRDLLFKIARFNGFELDRVLIEREKPQLSSELENELAKEAVLKNERLEMEVDAIRKGEVSIVDLMKPIPKGDSDGNKGERDGKMAKDVKKNVKDSEGSEKK